MYDYFDIKLSQKFFPERLRKIREARAKEYEREHKEPEEPGKKGPRPNRFSQKNLAEALKINRQTLLLWEQGIGLPSLEKAINLCILLDCDLDYLLGRCDTYHRVTAEISEATGLSTAAAEKLREWKHLPELEAVTDSADEISEGFFVMKVLNTLLTNKEGLTVLRDIGLYLYGTYKQILPYEDLVREMEDHYYEEAKIEQEKKWLQYCEHNLCFAIEGSAMSFELDTEALGSMFLSSVQESLANLKTKIDNAKGGRRLSRWPRQEGAGTAL